MLVNYNGLDDTLECLGSLFESSYRNLRVIVVDNGSEQDPAPVLLQTYPEVIIMRSKENRGFAAGCNIGITHALIQGADYVLLLNNDTIIDRSAIERLVDIMETHPEVAVAGGKIYYYDDPDRIWYAGGKILFPIIRCIHFKHGRIDTCDEAKDIVYTSFVTGCMMIVRSILFRTLGKLNEAYFYGIEDAEFCSRAEQHGYRLAYVPSAKLLHKIGRSRRGPAEWYVANLFYSRAIFARQLLKNDFLWGLWLDLMGLLYGLLWKMRGRHSYAHAIRVARRHAKLGSFPKPDDLSFRER